MRIVVHTPRVYVEEYDVDSLPVEATNADVMAALRDVDAATRRVSVSTIDTGVPFVYSRGADDLEEAGRLIREARAAEENALNAGRALAIAAMDAGTASERQVADAFGLNRSAVRAWRGKARSA